MRRREKDEESLEKTWRSRGPRGVAGSAVALLLAVATAGCRADPAAPLTPIDPTAFDGARAFAQAEGLVGLGPRDAGTAGAQRASRYLAGRLRAIGLEVEIEEFTAPAPGGPTVFRNVIGKIKGRGRGLVVLGSHYDTKPGIGPGFQGANDSGSSTGVLLELARVLKEGSAPGPDVWLAFFDGEEARERYDAHDGLQGSRHLAKRLVDNGLREKVRGAIVLDMVGDKDLTVTLPSNTDPELLSSVLRAAREEGARKRFSLAGMAFTDDHEPFLLAGMPAIDIIDFEFGSLPGRNDYWHTEADTLDKISPASLQVVGRVTIRVLNGLVEKP